MIGKKIEYIFLSILGMFGMSITDTTQVIDVEQLNQIDNINVFAIEEYNSILKFIVLMLTIAGFIHNFLRNKNKDINQNNNK